MAHWRRSGRPQAREFRRASEGNTLGIRILVVDDQARARFFVTSFVEELGHEVVAEAATGGSAIDEAARHEPDVVVMDFHMPLMDGLEATSVIKARQPAVQVIAYTSTDDPAVRQAFLDAGACEHVEKGDVEHLVRMLERCGEAAGAHDS